VQLPHQVLRAIIETDGEEAIHELRRIQAAHGLRDDGWLNDAMLRITDQLLAGVPWEPGQLLDFINSARLAVITSQRDLFEWTCDILEELKVTLERGLGVAGFWNVTGAQAEPKSEVECQNVLWALLDPLLRLRDLPIVTIQERLVGPDRCDFWVLYPRRDKPHFSVAVELKVARERYTAVDLIDPVESQLYEVYMRPEQCDYGIYIVLWFRDDNRYKGPTAWADVQMLEAEVRRRCSEVERSRGATVAGYVLNMTAPYRRR
jgi:hypothetical protein